MKKALHAKPFRLRLQMPGHAAPCTAGACPQQAAARRESVPGGRYALLASVSFQPATAATSMASLQNKLNSLSKSIDQHKKELSDAKEEGICGKGAGK